MCDCVCVRACVHAYLIVDVHACMGVSVSECVRVCVCACKCEFVNDLTCVRACV